MKVAVIGTGYVGLVTGSVLAQSGHQVICVDKDKAKLEMIQSGKSPIFEPQLDEILVQVLDQGFLRVSSDLVAATRESDCIFIAVGTPPKEDGSPDLSAVRAVAKELAAGINEYKVIVNKSTVPVGTGDLVEEIILEQGVDRHLFDVVSNPEFLREGAAIHDSRNPDRIVIGANNKAAALKLVELYAGFERPMLLTDTRSAELIKYASNSFLALKISYINAISRICEEVGANIGDVSRGVGTDARIGNQFLQAGLGWGGSCFPKDVLGLISIAKNVGYDFELMKEVDRINADQTSHFMSRMETIVGGISGKTFGLLGLAFKPNTDDIRDAKSSEIITYILERGGKIRCHDPEAMENMKRVYPQLNYCANAYDVANGSDALVLVTEWAAYRNLELSRLQSQMTSPVLFDGRRFFRAEEFRKAGWQYYTIGSH